MRVLYFHQHFTTPRGAGGTRSYELARRLVARGHHVTLVCGAHKGCETGLTAPAAKGLRRGMVDGIEVIELQLAYQNRDSLPKRSLTFARFALRSIGLAFTEPYDLLFATTTPLTAAIPGIVARAFKRQPFVFEVRDLWPELPVAMGVLTNPFVIKALELLEHTAYKSADACIGLSPGICEGILKHGIAKERVSMVPNGCDLELFRPAPEPKPPFPGLEQGDFVALFAGAHGLANGLDTAISAAESLERQGLRHIKLVFVGDGREKPKLVERARKAGLTQCVFLDPVDKMRLSEMMATADVGLMLLADVPAFYYGTSPNKFFDYLASGIAVLNNYPGWLAELIEAGGCGRIVPPRDGEALANALVEMAADRAGCREMGRRARQMAEEQFDREKLANRFVDVLERVAGHEPAHAHQRSITAAHE